jgi:hypothetical protein
MGQFVRDEAVRNLSIDEATLVALNDAFAAAALARNNQLAQAAAVQAGQGGGGAAAVPPAHLVFLSYVIRFDGKGYRYTAFNDVKQHYVDADDVERVVLNIDSGAHRQSSGLAGTDVELRLDKDANSCWLRVSSDDRHWVETTFTTIMDILARRRSASRFVRTQWTGAVVQLLGVTGGFLLSVLAAAALAPHLKLESAFTVSLIFLFLLFSNIWGYASGQFTVLLNAAFPSVAFKRKDKEGLRWLARGVVTRLTVAFIFLLANALGLIGTSLFNSFWK